jgi:hypothetical protein
MLKESDKSDFKYQTIGDKTMRSEIKLLPEEELKKVEKDLEISPEDIKKFALAPNISKGKPPYLEVKSYILQNPQLQLYGRVNNFAVCPFCKYTGTMIIQYEKSQYQKKCCIGLAFSVILSLCCWIPMIIRALSDQVYKCASCGKTLKTISHNDI